MQFQEPLCLRCKLFKSAPKSIGGKATCVAYPNGIPKSIYFEGKNCSKKSTTKKKTTTKRVAKTKKTVKKKG